MKKEEKKQIESINKEIYSNFKLEELEERLEMSKLAGPYACDCDNKDCKFTEAD